MSARQRSRTDKRKPEADARNNRPVRARSSTPRQEIRADRADAAHVGPRPGNVYLYGIVRWPVPEALSASDTTGVGEPARPVRAVRARSVAALVSDVSASAMSAAGTRGTRRDMKAHAALLNRLAGVATILPVRFGVVLPDEATLLSRILEPQYARLDQLLTQLDGTIEVTLKATYVEEQVLRDVMAARPELAAASRAAGAGPARGAGSLAQASRIELGRRIAAAIEDHRAQDARWLVAALRPVAPDVRVGRPLSDLMVLNASFLVRRAGLSRFDARLAEVQKEIGRRMTLDCVGPLPPYSFVDLRL
jgi:hypothetical protein